MRTKKFLAITMVALFALILVVPMASNTAAPNPLTATAATVILPQQDNTPSKAIPTNPLGPYNLTDGEILYYDGVGDDLLCFPVADWYSGDIHADYEFAYNDTQWGDWFIGLLGTGPIPSIAIHNQTREIGLNGTEPFEGVPTDESAITRRSGVYSFIAIPTGVKAGDNIKIMLPVFPVPEAPWIQVTFEVLGRVTTPIFGPTMEFYDTWILHGTYTGTIDDYPSSAAYELSFDTETGLLVAFTVGGSIAQGSPAELDGWCVLMQYNSSAGEDSPAVLPNTGVDYIDTAETNQLIGKTFTYNEDGYWYMDWSAPTNGSVGKVKLTSLEGSYINFSLEGVYGEWVFTPIGISQTTKIPDSLWNYFEPWNPTYYNSTTQIGHVGDWLDFVYIQNLTRWVGLDSPNTMFMAPPWIRDGAVFSGLAFLPLFWPDNTTPSVGVPSIPWGTITLLMPFRVSGAVPVVIDGNVYDCWKTELVIPTDLSDLNISQLQYQAYYERTSGIMIKAKADLEMKIYADGDLTPIGYHKTWTLANSSMLPPPSIKALPEPEEMSSYYNTYSMVFAGNVLDTLDPSLLNGGSVTANFSNEQYVTMWTTTRIEGNVSIDGKPIVKFMNVEIAPNSVTYNNASVNFHYTPSELRAMGARESGFTVYAWNGTAWEPLNTTLDAEGRVVSADAEHFSLFALVASELTLFDILGPGGTLLLLSSLGQAANPMGGLMLPLAGLGIGLLVIAIIAAFILRKPK